MVGVQPPENQYKKWQWAQEMEQFKSFLGIAKTDTVLLGLDTGVDDSELNTTDEIKECSQVSKNTNSESEYGSAGYSARHSFLDIFH
jgi:hypothetical protein